ncbi:MAG: hypothetical protein LUG93_13590 [Lachnospiraceae bacterium]|nr:hypothetical protein [Lachnospiraceae bacterium]
MKKPVNPFIGEKIIVGSGPLVDHTGTVVEMLSSNRVVVEMKMFGRYQRVRLRRDELLDEFGRPIPEFFSEKERNERIAEYKRLEEAVGEKELLECMKKMHISEEDQERLKNGEERVLTFFHDNICESLGVGMKWIIFGEEKWKEHPVGPQMKEYLGEHPERREQIWKWMQEDGYTIRDVTCDDDFEDEEEEEEDDWEDWDED